MDNKLLYNRSAETLKVHGILSIIFGGLGVLSALVMTITMIPFMVYGAAMGNFENSASTSYDDGSIFGLVMLGLTAIVFWILPHVYLIVSGAYLVRQPEPKVAKVLVIINLVIGVFWNLILLIFAIINLTQLADYERGYHAHKTKK